MQGGSYSRIVDKHNWSVPQNKRLCKYLNIYAGSFSLQPKQPGCSHTSAYLEYLKTTADVNSQNLTCAFNVYRNYLQK
jgi:hypothetical protein